MSLILATGSNLGNKLNHLDEAKYRLSKVFSLLAESQIYQSKAVDYLNQPDFFNQVLEFENHNFAPDSVMKTLLQIESEMGRTRQVKRGPRTIDIDLLFLGTTTYQTELVTIPHPRWRQRSFVVLPLKEVPYAKTLEKIFTFPQSFPNNATPVG